MVALAVLIFNLTLAMQATSILPIVDGWAVLNRIMHYNFGELSWDQYLFRTHSAHLHLIVYAVTWLDYHFFDGQQKLIQAVSLGATALFCLIIVTHIIRQGLRTKTPSLVIALAVAATVAILSGIANSETRLHPFQVVLSAARLPTWKMLLTSQGHKLCAISTCGINAFIIRHDIATGKFVPLTSGAAFDGYPILSKVAEDFWCTPDDSWHQV